jgi:hypothetical protein
MLAQGRRVSRRTLGMRVAYESSVEPTTMRQTRVFRDRNNRHVGSGPREDALHRYASHWPAAGCFGLGWPPSDALSWTRPKNCVHDPYSQGARMKADVG